MLVYDFEYLCSVRIQNDSVPAALGLPLKPTSIPWDKLLTIFFSFCSMKFICMCNAISELDLFKNDGITHSNDVPVFFRSL